MQPDNPDPINPNPAADPLAAPQTSQPPTQQPVQPPPDPAFQPQAFQTAQPQPMPQSTDPFTTSVNPQQVVQNDPAPVNPGIAPAQSISQFPAQMRISQPSNMSTYGPPNGSETVNKVQINPTNPAEQAQGLAEYAGFGNRLLALVVDMVIFMIVLTVILFPIALVMGMTGSSESDAISSTITTLTNIISIPLSWAYFIGFTAKKGQTPGKMALKIKVVRSDDGQTPGFLKAFLREVVGKWLSSIFLLGYLWPLWDDKKQGWHDKIAGTTVVKVVK